MSRKMISDKPDKHMLIAVGMEENDFVEGHKTLTAALNKMIGEHKVTPAAMLYMLVMTIAKSLAFYEDTDRPQQMDWVMKTIQWMVPNYRAHFLVIDRLKTDDKVVIFRKPEGSA